jgi:hypothetical protein
MNERNWLNCDTWRPIREHLRWRASARKRLLFVAACCRVAFAPFPDVRGLRAIEALERLADDSFAHREAAPFIMDVEAMIYEVGRQGESALDAYYAESGTCSCGYCPETEESAARAEALNPAVDADFGYRLMETSRAAEVAADAGETLCRLLGSSHDAVATVEQVDFLPLEQARPLLHELFCNPFRPVVLQAAWLAWNDHCIERIAQAIYDERAFDRMPILADALEDAGCDNADILNHCRGDGPHVRGCWVVDLLLDKQ